MNRQRQQQEAGQADTVLRWGFSCRSHPNARPELNAAPVSPQWARSMSPLRASGIQQPSELPPVHVGGGAHKYTPGSRGRACPACGDSAGVTCSASGRDPPPPAAEVAARKRLRRRRGDPAADAEFTDLRSLLAPGALGGGLARAALPQPRRQSGYGRCRSPGSPPAAILRARSAPSDAGRRELLS